MARKDRRAAQAEPLGADQALTELGRALAGLQPAGAPEEAPGAGDAAGSADETGAEVELTLAELVGDANGEVVFFNDSSFLTLGITTDATVMEEGETGRHATAAGVDVSGYRFVRFDNGLTLYYESGLELVVRPAPAAG